MCVYVNKSCLKVSCASRLIYSLNQLLYVLIRKLKEPFFDNLFTGESWLVLDVTYPTDLVVRVRKRETRATSSYFGLGFRKRDSVGYPIFSENQCET